MLAWEVVLLNAICGDVTSTVCIWVVSGWRAVMVGLHFSGTGAGDGFLAEFNMETPGRPPITDPDGNIEIACPCR